MQDDINGLFLNQVINGLLFLILIILCLNSIIERRKEKMEQDTYFSKFVFFSTAYVGLSALWLPYRESNVECTIFSILCYSRIFCAMMAYSYVGNWLIKIIEEKSQVASYFKYITRYGIFALFIISFLLRITFHTFHVANIPIYVYYLVLELLVLFYHKELGNECASIITIFIIPTLLLQVQPWWHYTPPNIYLVLCIMTIYVRVWAGEKKEFTDMQRILVEEEVELEKERTDLVLSQFKPHFIYNTMSTIIYLCTKKPESAKKLSIDFSDYLRGNLQALDSDELIPFDIELEHIKAYLKIECVRFEDTLHVDYDIQSTNFSIPVLTVEPLVENSVMHGICQKDEGGTVTICSRELSDCYEVIVKDDGVGFDVNQLKSTEHVGIRSIQKRIELLCHGTLSIKSKRNVGTITVLKIPKYS